MNRKLTVTLLGSLALCGLGSQPLRAGLVVNAPFLTLAPGTTGSFDITLTNNGPSDVDISAFSFEIGTSNPAIAFTDATVFTTNPYIFAGDSAFGPDLALSSGQSLMASDVPLDLVSPVIPPGAVVGSGLVSYSIDAGAAPGQFAIAFTTDASTSLADSEGNDLPIDTPNGQITISGTESDAPEPGGWFLGAGGLLTFLWMRRFIHRRA